VSHKIIILLGLIGLSVTIVGCTSCSLKAPEVVPAPADDDDSSDYYMMEGC
jgi:hypothetical protein